MHFKLPSAVIQVAIISTQKMEKQLYKVIALLFTSPLLQTPIQVPVGISEASTKPMKNFFITVCNIEFCTLTDRNIYIGLLNEAKDEKELICSYGHPHQVSDETSFNWFQLQLQFLRKKPENGLYQIIVQQQP